MIKLLCISIHQWRWALWRRLALSVNQRKFREFGRKILNYINFNPYIRSVSLYERINKTDECVGYDSRIIYLISGELSPTVGGEKLGHMSPGNLLYIPAGVPYKLKSKYLRAVVITFDPTSKNPDPADRMSPVPTEAYDERLAHMDGIAPPFDRYLKIDDMESERDTFIRMSNIFTSAEGNYRAQLSAMLKLIMLRIADTVDVGALPSVMVAKLGDSLASCAELVVSCTPSTVIL